jgi:septal ring factor EnvC (AmiA/AmiB activator)
MKRLVTLVLLLAQTGCLSQFTSRLDRGNDQLVCIRGELARGNAQLAESAERLRQMEKHLADVTQKMATMERFLKRFGAGADGGVSVGDEGKPVPGEAPAGDVSPGPR